MRSRISISDVVGQKVKLVKKGREYMGLCPFHNEKTPSFTVNEEKEFYHCFGCGAHGDAIKFLTDSQHYTFTEAVTELAKKAGLPLPVSDASSVPYEKKEDLEPLHKALQEATRWYQNNLFLMRHTQALKYIENRGLSHATLKQFCIGYAPDDFHGVEKYLNQQKFTNETLLKAGLLSQKDENSKPHDRFRHRIIFPIHDHKGQIVGFGGRLIGQGEPKYLNSPETTVYAKSKLLYGYHIAKNKPNSDPIIIVEGYIDVLSLQQAGYSGAVAPLGTALTEDQILLAWRICPEPILCFDGDPAGFKAASRAAERVLPLVKPGYSLKFCILPSGEDPDSLVQSKNDFQKVLDSSYSLVDMLWHILTHGKSFKTPEQKAALQRQCALWENAIKNSDVKKSYHYAFKDLFYRTIVRTNSSHKPSKLNKLRNIKLINIQEKLLLAILINHPKIIDVGSDELATLDFKDKSLHRVRECILEFYSHQDPSNGKLKEFLLNADLKDELENILSPNVLIHGSFAEPTASYEVALQGWNDIVCQMRKEETLLDVKNARDDLASCMSLETWNRLKMLKTGTLKQD